MCYMGARRGEREMLINCHISSHTLSFVPMSLMVCELSIFLSLSPFYVLSMNSWPFMWSIFL